MRLFYSTDDVALIITAGVMYAAAFLASFALTRPRNRPSQVLRGINRMRIGLIVEGTALTILALAGQNRVLHPVACGLGIAGSLIIGVGFITVAGKTGVLR